MPTLGNALDFAKYEARNIRAHILGTAPSSPVTGQMYFNSGDNTLWWWDGSQWVSARGGASATPPATVSALGTIQLAGDLSGTATSPQIASGAIVDADVNGTAAIAEGKLNLASDAAAGTASRRTLGTGATQAAAGNDARFTNARAPTAHATTHQPGGSDAMAVDAAAATGSLRSLTMGSATAAMPSNADLTLISTVNVTSGDVNVNGKKLTAVGDPTTATDGANKSYVDNVAQGLDAKPSVRGASVSNQPLSGTFTQDGVALTIGDRVLMKDQTAQAQNGIYVVAAGAWTRAPDADTWAELPGAFVFVEQGTTNADSGWVCTADQGGTLGTTAVTWTQFSGAGQIIAGEALTKLGNTINVVAGVGLTTAADLIYIGNNQVTNAMIADGAINLATADVTGALPVANGGTGQTTAYTGRTALGATGRYIGTGPPSTGTTWSIPAGTHALQADQYLIVQVADIATRQIELPDITIGTTGGVTITWGASVTLNTKNVVIVG